jgi:prevent-host-death family protein
MYMKMYRSHPMMSKSYSIAEARERFSEVVDRAFSGSPVRISRRGKPVAVVVAASWFDAQQRTKTSFWEATRRWRKRVDDENIDLNPDEIFGDVRDKSPGRDFKW